jgi:hypothetical protein
MLVIGGVTPQVFEHGDEFIGCHAAGHLATVTLASWRDGSVDAARMEVSAGGEVVVVMLVLLLEEEGEAPDDDDDEQKGGSPA